jgi:hypothetical protein
MTVKEFREMIDAEAMKRMGLTDYVKKKTRPDKYLKEAHLPMLGVIYHKGTLDTATIELGALGENSRRSDFCSDSLDLRAQAEVPSARRTDTPKAVRLCVMLAEIMARNRAEIGALIRPGGAIEGAAEPAAE